ncbi:hypothetical protein MFLAVUS_003945 [Mucor flavus]|uniref:Uncharacterized protein n=1 Tax=Mucor flavus TaxID=439312 RepID=A0ABP9YUJ4_9FUNG
MDVWSLLITITGVAILYDRVIRKKLPIFDYESSLGRYIRPRPIESMILFGIIFNFLRALDAVLLVSDAVSNVIVLALLYELPWQFGLSAFSCYLFGIAHTVSHSSKVIRNNWFRSSIRIDIMCTSLITLPFITNNICVIAASIYAERNQLSKAKFFTDLLYYFWTFYCFTLSIFILFAGARLLKILGLHLKNQSDPESSAVQKIKHGAFKVRMVMLISITSLLIFSVIKCTYGIFRKEILLNGMLNLLVAIFWTFDGTFASTFVILTLLINPKALTQLNISSTDGSDTYAATRSQLGSASNITPIDVNIIAYQQGGYPLSNLPSFNEPVKEKYYPFIGSSEFEGLAISETHLLPDTKRYNM